MGNSQTNIQPTAQLSGSWLGNQQLAVLPSIKYEEADIIRKNPFFIIKIKRVAKDDLERTPEPESLRKIEASLDSKARKSAKLVVFNRSGTTKMEVVPTEPLPCKTVLVKAGETPPWLKKDEESPYDPQPPANETADAKQIRMQTNIGFTFKDAPIDQTVTYFIYCVNTQPIEADYTTWVNNLSPYHKIDVTLPKQFNVKYFLKEELEKETSVDGVFSGFTEYGGPPTTYKNTDWLCNNMHFRMTVTKPTRCMFILKRIEGNFPIGLIVMSCHENDDDNYLTKDIESRVIAHSVFPLTDTSEEISLKCLLSPLTTGSVYTIFIVPDKKRRVGKYNMKVISDHVFEGSGVRPKLSTKTLESVWMKRVTNEEPPGHPMFFFTLVKPSYLSFVVSISTDQKDNTENIRVKGKIICKQEDDYINDYNLDLEREPKKSSKFSGHFDGKTKYSLWMEVDTDSDRDVIFEITMTSLTSANADLLHGPINESFVFRSVPGMKPKSFNAEPLSWGGAFGAIVCDWTMKNSGGDEHFFDDYPQLLVSFTPGTTFTEVARVRITLEHDDKTIPDQSQQVFYVYDVDDYIKANRSDYPVQELIKYKFSVKDEQNRDKWKRLLRSKPSNDNYYVEEIFDVDCDWNLADEKYLLVVPVPLVQRTGKFRVTAQCVDIPTVIGRRITLKHLDDVWFDQVQSFRSSWVGVGGGDIGGDLFSYNPYFQIKITVPDTQLICKMIPVGREENNNIRVAMYLFEPENEQDHVFLSRNLRFKCEWSNFSRVLLSATLSPEVFEDQPLIRTYYLVCSTYEEGCNMNFDLKISSSRPIRVRQIN